MRTILVANAKGGCGKTTLATNLAGIFAACGMKTALADVDRQRNSLRWCAMRPDRVAGVRALSWVRIPPETPKKFARLVIDAPAGIAQRRLDSLVKRADLVVVPALPSVFDEQVTARFVARVERIKTVQRNRTGLLLVANRIRPGTRAAQRLDIFIRSLGHRAAGHIVEHPVYGELAYEGLSLFDTDSPQACDNAVHWLPLLRRIASEPGPDRA